jgi:hypothetical protein
MTLSGKAGGCIFSGHFLSEVWHFVWNEQAGSFPVCLSRVLVKMLPCATSKILNQSQNVSCRNVLSQCQYLKRIREWHPFFLPGRRTSICPFLLVFKVGDLIPSRFSLAAQNQKRVSFVPLDYELVDFVSHGRLQYSDLEIMWSTNQN